MKSNIQKPLHKKSKFNRIDLVLAFFAILVLVAIISYLNPREWFDAFFEEEPTGELTYTVMIKGLDTNTAKSIREGNSVRNSDEDSDIGSIVGTPHIFNYYEWVEVEIDGKTETQRKVKSNVSIDVKVSCIYVEDVGYFVNGRQILVGEPIDVIIYTDEYLNCDCINISYVAREGSAE